ncbi:MAG: glycosyltransferase [Conexivisphaerales archaeon]
MKDLQKRPLVSVIIPTKNSARTIGDCLLSIQKQTYDNLEIIVVDNNSTDITFEIAQKFTQKAYRYGPERSAQRNYGASKALGQYLLFVDSDMTLTPNVIDECINTCQENNVVATYIPEKIIGKGFMIKIRDFERSFYTGTVIDAVRFIKKDVFQQTGGFDERMTGVEDWDLDRKVKCYGKTRVINSFILHNEGKFDTKKYLEKKEYYIKSGLELYKEKWNNDEIVKMQLGAYYRLWKVFTEKGKWKKFFKHPILSLGVCYLRIRVGLRYLSSS